MQIRVVTGSVIETPTTLIQVNESNQLVDEAEKIPPQSFRVRLGAKLKLVLEWMQERLFFFIR